MNIDQDKLNLVKIWDHTLRGARNYVEKNNYKNVVGVPLLAGISGSCENVQTLFKIEDAKSFFGQSAYLLQSGQLLLELIASKLQKTYCHVTSFRAEPEVNSRHLCSFELFEIELQTSFDGLLIEISNILQAICDELVLNCSEELLYFGRNPKDLINLDFNRLTYTEAVEFLKQNGFPELSWGDDLKLKHELVLGDNFGILLLHRFPKEIKFFNMLEDPENPDQVLSMDLILPGVGESCGSASREFSYEKIIKRLKESSMYKHLIELGGSDEDFEWFLSYYKDNEVPPHAGAGLGLNRIVNWILFPHTQGDIRKATVFPVNRETLF